MKAHNCQHTLGFEPARGLAALRPVVCEVRPVEQGPARQGQHRSEGQRPDNTTFPSRKTCAGSSTGRENKSVWHHQQGRGSQASPKTQPALGLSRVTEHILAGTAQALTFSVSTREKVSPDSLTLCPNLIITAMHCTPSHAGSGEVLVTLRSKPQTRHTPHLLIAGWSGETAR